MARVTNVPRPGVGLYAMLSCVVAQKTHEIGIRIALGAQGRDVFRLMAQQLLLFMSVGVVVGCLSSFWHKQDCFKFAWTVTSRTA